MKRFFLFPLAVLIFNPIFGADTTTSQPNPDEVFAKLPLAFEANHGQTDPRVKFFARGNGYTAFLTSDEVVLALSKRIREKNPEPRGEKLGSERGKETILSATVRMRMLNANPDVVIAPHGEPKSSRITYLTQSGGAPLYPSVYPEVEYREIWPGVSMVHYGTKRQLEYDFVVAPGANLSAIRLAFEGAEQLAVDVKGDLVGVTAAGELRVPAPTLYQEINGQHISVVGGYILAGNQVSFRVGRYDTSRPLIIDPTLEVADSWGGSGQDYAEAVTVDPKTGAIYVAGYTSSPDFPVSDGSTWRGNSLAFVSKISADGKSLLFSTMFGGSFDNDARGIALDAAGNIWLTGATDSNDFPHLPVRISCGLPCQQYGGPTQTPSKFFVVSLTPQGQYRLIAALGGSRDDYGNAIAVDGQGRIFVAGRTYSTDMPNLWTGEHLKGASDAFVSVLTADQYNDLTVVRTTYLGGTGDESAKAIAIVPNNQTVDLIVAGWTSSWDFPATNGVAQTSFHGGDADGFVTRVQFAPATNYTPSIYYSTYLGGEDEEIVYGIWVDGSGSARLTGYTRSKSFPTTYGSYQRFFGGGSSDAFLTRLDGNGRLVYSTYFGGSGDDYGRAIVVYGTYVYIVGYTDSWDLSVTNNAFQRYPAGGWDIFASVFLDDGEHFQYGSYFGFWGDEFAYAAALDSSGTLVFAGSTDSTYSGATNVLLFKLDMGF